MKELLLKFTTSPIGFIKTVLYKLTMGPVIYGKGDDYDAGRYWRDRLSKYGKSIRGVGDQSLSDDGVFILAPLLKTKKRVMFYLSDWTIDNLKSCFKDNKIGESIPFRTGYLLSIKK